MASGLAGHQPMMIYLNENACASPKWNFWYEVPVKGPEMGF